ncbi:MAG: glycerophosphodiester phosphodiesterase [Leptospiraceae bacterium]|nr:glycerophosphodiester phosphodiesterase [Leptospiraceae bacterium]
MIKLILLLLIGIFLPTYFYLRSLPLTINDAFNFDGKEFRIAHRCGKAVLPENTLFACKEIFNHNLADILEMDVHLTKDNRLVVIHDDSVDRTTNGKGKVVELSYEEIKRLDAGFHFSTDGENFPFRGKGISILELEEFFKTLPNARYYIEVKVKDPLAAEILVQLIEKYKLENRVLIGSVRDSVNENLKQLSRGKITVFSGLKEVISWYFAYLLEIRGIVNPPQVLAIPNLPRMMPITENFIKAVKEQNSKLHIFTINDKEQILNLKTLGVDGVMTDNPYLFEKL